MSMLDGLLKQVAGSPDTVASLAEQVGLDAGMVEKAVAALGAAHPQEGDTIELASAKTGLDTGALGGILSQLGGEGALGDLSERLQGDSQLSGIMDMLDQDGDGNPLDDIANIASGLFGRK